MLFADHYILEWAGAIGGSITVVGGALLGLYFLFRKNRTSANEADGKVERTARQEQMGIDAAAMQKVIDDLRKANENLMSQMSVIQSSTLVKIIEAHDEHHECEKKYATLETKYSHLEDKYTHLEDEYTEVKDKVKALEEQLSKKEGK